MRLICLTIAIGIHCCGGCAVEYRYMTFKVVDQATMTPIEGAQFESFRPGEVLPLHAEPIWVEGSSDKNGIFNANVPVVPSRASHMLVTASGYEDAHLERYLEDNGKERTLIVVQMKQKRKED